MALDKDTVRNIAYLARIRVPEEDLDGLAGELSGIMDWIEQLQEVDTNGVTPMTSVVHMAPRMRDDVVNDGDCRDRVVANAPDGVDGFFTVPKVVE